MTLKDLEVNKTIIDLESNNQKVICNVFKNKLLKSNYDNNEVIYNVQYIFIDSEYNLIYTDVVNYELNYFTEDNINVHISIMDEILDFLYYFIEEVNDFENIDVNEILRQFRNMDVNKFYKSYKK